MTYGRERDHPARIEEFTKALYASPEGQVVMAHLRDLFRTAPRFELLDRPRDEWDYVAALVKQLKQLDFPRAAERAESLEVLETRHRQRVARIEELSSELRAAPEGQAAAEGLARALSGAPDLALWRLPGGAWQFLAALVLRLTEDEELCGRVFATRADAFAAGADFAQASTLHEHVYEPFRKGLG